MLILYLRIRASFAALRRDKTGYLIDRESVPPVAPQARSHKLQECGGRVPIDLAAKHSSAEQSEINGQPGLRVDSLRSLG